MIAQSQAPVTLLLLAITGLVSVMAFSNQRLFTELMFEPFVIKARGQWHRFITHAFVHSGWPHLLVNAMVLFGFGQHVEGEFALYAPAAPSMVYLSLYIGGILFSSLAAYKRHMHDPDYRAVGASGAVSSVLFAYILMTPANKISLMLFPVGLPAWMFGGLYLLYSWYMDKKRSDNVAHDAHFYGALFGLAFMVILDPGILGRFIEQLTGA